MPKYIFILGHSPALSILEIIKTLPRLSSNPKIVLMTKEILIVEMKNEINEQLIQEVLGGTIKIGKIFQEIDLEKLLSLERIIIQLIKEKNQTSKKIKFGFSLYFFNSDYPKDIWQKKFYQLGLRIKRNLKNDHLNSRFIVSHEPNLSSIIIQKEKLINQGFDFIIFFSKNKIYFAKTNTCQDFKKYISDDWQRPSSDARSGMLPVKLAKIMINLSQAEQDKIILDPFCGVGTILQEALILGYRHLIGSDEKNQAIKNSKNNLDWLIKKLKLKSTDYQLRFYQLAVQQLIKEIPIDSIGIIVTEPYLGSPHKSQAEQSFRLEESKYLEDLYYQSFYSFFPILKKGGKVVIVFPVFKITQPGRDEFIYLSNNLIEKIRSLGFSQEDLTLIFKNYPEFSPFLTKRQSILYFRPHQRVQRELIIFQKE